MIAVRWSLPAGLIAIGFGVFHLVKPGLPARMARMVTIGANAFAAIVVYVVLTHHWEPLGPTPGLAANLVFCT